MVCMLGVIPDTDYLIELYEDMNICLASFTKKDFLIFFSNYNTITDTGVLDWLDERPFTSVVIDVDNSIYENSKDLIKTKRFGRGAYKLSDSVYAVTESGLYKIGGRKLLICPLARAEQKPMKERIARYEQQMAKFSKACESNTDSDVDIITGTPPQIISREIARGSSFDVHSLFYDRFARNYTFKRWFSVYLGIDDVFMDKFYCVDIDVTALDGSELINYLDTCIDI